MRAPSTLLLLEVAMLGAFEFLQGASGASAKNPKASEKPSAKQGMSLMIPGGSVLYPYGQSQALNSFPQQVFYPGFQDYSNYYDFPPAPPQEKPQSNQFIVLLILLFNLLNSATETTTTTSSAPTETVPTTAEPGGNCQWYPWSSCSAPCRGTRYRTRMCLGRTQTDTEICNTQTGYLPDGQWYRAKNCHDYLWVSTQNGLNYQDSATACSELGARLASTGMRDDSVRTDIFANIPLADGASTSTYIGVSDQTVAGVYVWSDGHEGNPSFWMYGQPNEPDDRCAVIEDRDPWSLEDNDCTDEHDYLCEKVSQ